MASTKRFLVFQNISDGYSVTGTPLVSPPTNVQDLDNITVQVQALSSLGGPHGTVTIQGSLDYSQGTGGTVLNAGHWFDLTTVPSTLTLSSVTTSGLTVQPNSVPWIKVTITETTDGYYNSWICGKSV